MVDKILEINAKISEIKYNYLLSSNLKEFDITDVQTGECFKSGAFKLRMGDNIFGVSTWVSPKRTRSYPFERVYNTCHLNKKVTIIPLVKDEGKQGDRDYIQWDTVSLMSLLNVYVIICWYDSARKSNRYKNKITSQEYNYKYIHNKLKSLEAYQSDALHWNVKQVEDLKEISQRIKDFYYNKVPQELGVEMKGKDSYEKKIEKITRDAESFKQSSRSEAISAQNRESLTIQPKENVIFDKGKINIKNMIGGEYYWTVDELVLINDNVYLIEKKGGRNKIPSISDIKDGLLKHVLYSNINSAKVKGKNINVVPVMGLTGDKFKGVFTTVDNLATKTAKDFEIDERSYNTIKDVFNEAKTNGITVFVANSKYLTKENQKEILKSFTAT
jgi:hypothetical protein